MSRISSSIVSVAAFLCTSVAVYLFGGKPVGWAKAHIDLRRGIYRLVEIGGPPRPWEPELTRVYAEKYQIETDRIAYCFVMPWDEGYWEGYNSVSIPAIKKKYSETFRDDATKAAIREYMRTHNLTDEQKVRCRQFIRKIESR